MADNKAATAAAQTQSDKPKKNDGKKKVSFFDKVKNFFKGIGKYFKDTKSELKKVCLLYTSNTYRSCPRRSRRPQYGRGAARRKARPASPSAGRSALPTGTRGGRGPRCV